MASGKLVRRAMEQRGEMAAHGAKLFGRATRAAGARREGRLGNKGAQGQRGGREGGAIRCRLGYEATVRGWAGIGGRWRRDGGDWLGRG